jgi:hypothetical protein
MEVPVEKEVEKQVQKSLAPGLPAPEQESVQSEFFSVAIGAKLQKEQFLQ